VCRNSLFPAGWNSPYKVNTALMPWKQHQLAAKAAIKLFVDNFVCFFGRSVWAVQMLSARPALSSLAASSRLLIIIIFSYSVVHSPQSEAAKQSGPIATLK
jgi:hypothetical protein